jgi:hypothetical protein
MRWRESRLEGIEAQDVPVVPLVPDLHEGAEDQGGGKMSRENEKAETRWPLIRRINFLFDF